MSFEIPTQIELTGTNLLIAGGVLHFLMATFMHYGWLRGVKKVVRDHNKTGGSKIVMDDFLACLVGVCTYSIGPEWKIIETTFYSVVRVAGSILTASNFKPWKLHSFLTKVDEDCTQLVL